MSRQNNDPNLQTLQFVHEGVRYMALEDDDIIVHYPLTELNPVVLDRVPHICYSDQCCRVARTRLDQFPVGTSPHRTISPSVKNDTSH